MITLIFAQIIFCIIFFKILESHYGQAGVTGAVSASAAEAEKSMLLLRVVTRLWNNFLRFIDASPGLKNVKYSIFFVLCYLTDFSTMAHLFTVTPFLLFVFVMYYCAAPYIAVRLIDNQEQFNNTFQFSLDFMKRAGIDISSSFEAFKIGDGEEIYEFFLGLMPYDVIPMLIMGFLKTDNSVVQTRLNLDLVLVPSVIVALVLGAGFVAQFVAFCARVVTTNALICSTLERQSNSIVSILDCIGKVIAVIEIGQQQPQPQPQQTAEEDADDQPHQAVIEPSKGAAGSASLGKKAAAVCSNCGKSSQELQGVRLQRCSRCGVARYCSELCQQIHWKNGHKEQCKDIVAQQQPQSPQLASAGSPVVEPSTAAQQ